MPLAPQSLLMTKRVAAGGGGWTPISLGSALKWWVDFSDTASITSSGGAVSSVADKSGNGIAATQSTSGSRPLTGTTTINGLNTLRFDGLDDGLTLATNPLAGATAGHVFYVFALTSDPPTAPDRTGPVVGNWGSDANGDHEPFNDGNIYHGFGSTVRRNIGNPTPSLATPRQVDVWSAANDWAYVVDGITHYSTATNTVGWRTPPGVYVGLNTIGGTFAIDARIAEIFAANVKVTGSDLTNARAYLKTKWGTP